MTDGPGLRVDPWTTFNFAVGLVDSTGTLDMSPQSIASASCGGFAECAGLELSQDVERYEEGGSNGTVLQFPTRVKWTNLTLRRGMTANTALWDWHFAYVQGRGRRRDGFVALLDERATPVAVWAFRRGFPVKYSGPALNANQNQVAIEAIEIAHEGLVQIPSFSGAGEPPRTPATGA